MKELVSILLPASIQAARVHQNTIRHNTYQSFAATVLLFMILSGLVALRLNQKIVDNGMISTIPTITINVDPVQTQPEHTESRIVPSSTNDLAHASTLSLRDTVPLLDIAQSTATMARDNTSVPGTFTGAGLNDHGGTQSQGGTGGDDVTAQNNLDVFENIPEVDAQVNLAALQAQVEYPEFMRRIGASGKVVVVVAIDARGKAVRAQVESSTDNGFNAAAIKAVMGMNYTPARNAGEAVPSSLAIPISFRMQ